MLGEKGLLGHTQGLYEPVLHVPLLIRHPGFGGLAGRRFGQLVERVDLMPTLLDFAGSAYDPADFQGRSLLPLFDDPAAPWRTYAFAASKRDLSVLGDRDLEERVARDGRWKLHHYLYKDAYELYDLAADPLETTNVAPQHPDVVAKLSFELVGFMERNRPHAPGPIQDLNKVEFAAPRKD
jgi:arylsulfatase A-like enzyme